MQQLRQEESTSRTDVTMPHASSQAMDVDSEIELMECDKIPADETFENRDLAFITHWRLATEHFEKSFCSTSWVDQLSERMTSPRLQFMQIRCLRYKGNYGIVGRVINVPCDVDELVRQLPRHLDDDQAINVNLKKSIVHKSAYFSGCVKKSVLKAWLSS
jgi:hypothetical protein